ncbi:MAG TPA: LPS export ABC transporter ATP-binding protein, partial [Planctomycetaceae bacterium]|nr:LPS export ABC transporter ATP-binding protein [Planctomycetaceae bacterium]
YIICDGQVLVSGSAEKVLADPGAIARYFGKRFDANSIIDGRDSFRKSA